MKNIEKVLVWLGLKPSKWDRIAFALAKAGFDGIYKPLRSERLGKINGEEVRLHFFFNTSHWVGGVPQKFTMAGETLNRIVLEVGGVDLSCEDGPHLDMALGWAESAALRRQTELAEERQQMLAKIS